MKLPKPKIVTKEDVVAIVFIAATLMAAWLLASLG